MDLDRDDPTARALALLAALTARARWRGDELAERLGVTTRTVRRDVDRLRRLGYEIDGTTGADGGYRLRSGKAVPPLFLDADESVAVVTALVAAASDRRSGMVDASSRALAKLHHVLPPEVRRRAEAVRTAVRAASTAAGNSLDPSRLATLAEACRDEVAVRFAYVARGAQPTERRVEPHALVTVRRTWYLVGFDLDRDDWRTFRLDRLHGEVEVTGHGIARRSVPGGDPLAYLLDALADASLPHVAEVDVATGREAVLDAIPWLGHKRVLDAGAGACRVRLSAPHPSVLTRQLTDLAAAVPTGAIRADPATADHLARMADALRPVVRTR